MTKSELDCYCSHFTVLHLEKNATDATTHGISACRYVFDIFIHVHKFAHCKDGSHKVFVILKNIYMDITGYQQWHKILSISFNLCRY